MWLRGCCRAFLYTYGKYIHVTADELYRKCFTKAPDRGDNICAFCAEELAAAFNREAHDGQCGEYIRQVHRQFAQELERLVDDAQKKESAKRVVSIHESQSDPRSLLSLLYSKIRLTDMVLSESLKIKLDLYSVRTAQCLADRT